MNKNSIYGNSSFWFDSKWDVEDDFDILTGEDIEKKPGKDLIKLAAYQRAISNFVNIVTGEIIPVTFKNNNDGSSHTDGKTVVISSNLKDKDFDPAVGLALHEGAHVKLSDFKLLKFLMDGNVDDEVVDTIRQKYSMDIIQATYYVKTKIKMLLNVVEDRRIDNFIYRSAPGYQGYYHAMYDRYFNSKIIDKALQSSEKTDLDWESYLFRIINITNHNRNMKALPGMMEIWKALDLKNIGRLNSTAEALAVAYALFCIVEKYIPVPEDCESTPSNCENGENGEEGQGGNCSSEVSDEQVEDGNVCDDGSKAEGGEAKKGSSNQGGATQTQDLPELTDGQKRQLEKAIEKQRKMMENDIKKTGLSKKDAVILNSLAKGNEYSTEEVARGLEAGDWKGTVCKGINVLVVDNVKPSTIKKDTFDIFKKYEANWQSEDLLERKNIVDAGFRLGARLGSKLKVRNEVKQLDFNRLPKGRLDKRLLSALGYGAENVFKTTLVEKYNNANLHISIDASGSMSGKRYDNAMISAIAIAKAAQMAGNINVQISFRTTTELNGVNTPVVIMAYDSRKDNIYKIKTVFPHVCRLGVTPEGLCFEAIQKQILSASTDTDSYFLNFSDGEPWFNQTGSGFEYWGEAAVKHGRKEIEKMRDKGVKVMSYFIDGNKESGSWTRFKGMYGNDSQAIDTTNLTQLAKTLNDMFLKK